MLARDINLYQFKFKLSSTSRVVNKFIIWNRCTRGRKLWGKVPMIVICDIFEFIKAGCLVIIKVLEVGSRRFTCELAISQCRRRKTKAKQAFVLSLCRIICRKTYQHVPLLLHFCSHFVQDVFQIWIRIHFLYSLVMFQSAFFACAVRI